MCNVCLCKILQRNNQLAARSNRNCLQVPKAESSGAGNSDDPLVAVRIEVLSATGAANGYLMHTEREKELLQQLETSAQELGTIRQS